MADLRTIYIINNRDLRIRVKDVMRYLRIKETDSTMRRLLEECSDCVYNAAVPKAVYSKVDIKVNKAKETVDFGFMKVKSQNLVTLLEDCDKAYVMATTLGIGVDRLFDKYMRILQTKATVCDATASALVESFCDYVNDFITDGEEIISFQIHTDCISETVGR